MTSIVTVRSLLHVRINLITLSLTHIFVEKNNIHSKFRFMLHFYISIVSTTVILPSG